MEVFKRKFIIVDVGYKTPCWQWTDRPNRYGYAVLKIDGKIHRANRVSWRLHYGEIPHKLLACHRCDNRMCVNPEHIFLGTHKDNMQDAVLKGRVFCGKGELNGNSRLTPSQVLEIRKLHPEFSYTKLGKRFGVDRTAIFLIVKRKSWKHL